MGRTARDNRDLPHPKPVQKIELSEENTRRRLIAAGLLLLVGAAALAYAFFKLMTPETGWQAIQVNSSAGATCGGEFVFLYDLGSGDTPVQAESRAVTALYSQACRTAYQLFHTEESFQGLTNLRDINQHPNEVLRVDAVLYRAFLTVQAFGDRTIYLGPVYARYGDLFYCEDDAQLVDFDPYLSDEVRQEYAGIAAYAMDPQSIDVELLEDFQVCLRVSEDYLAYAQREGITDFLDFGWLQNAFIADYLANELVQAGYTHGTISSYDGFSQNLDGRGLTYALNLYDQLDGRPIQAATMEYQGPMSLVSLRSFPVDGSEAQRFYQLKDGQVRTMYLDPADGLCKSAFDSVACYSRTLGCAELALSAGPVCIADVIREDLLAALVDRDIQFVCCYDRTFYASDPELVLTDLYRLNGVEYGVEVY